MVVFAIGVGMYMAFSNGRLVGYLVPLHKGEYGNANRYQVYRLDNEGNRMPQGILPMSEARKLFGAIYCS